MEIKECLEGALAGLDNKCMKGIDRRIKNRLRILALVTEWPYI